jgi:uncharacterized protein YaaN involved in tellurite resistance
LVDPALAPSLLPDSVQKKRIAMQQAVASQANRMLRRVATLLRERIEDTQ